MNNYVIKRNFLKDFNEYKVIELPFTINQYKIFVSTRSLNVKSTKYVIVSALPNTKAVTIHQEVKDGALPEAVRFLLYY